MDSTKDLLNTIKKAMDSKMYGSIEVYLEAGSITQITQRIIKKMAKPKKVQATKPAEAPAKIKNPTSTSRDSDTPIKYHS